MLKEIQKILKDKSTKEGKAAFQKFVPFSQKTYGVRVPELNELAKRYSHGGFDLAERLWSSSAFEERLLAAKIVGRIGKKDPQKNLDFIAQHVHDIHDWCVCDTLATQGLRSIAKLRQKEIFKIAAQLVHSNNFWERRFALVMVEIFTKEKKHHKEIKKLIGVVKNDDEYYVKKAIAWLKRNLKKVDDD